MNRRLPICIALVAVALIAVIASGWALRFLAGPGPANRSVPGIAAIDPCAGSDVSADMAAPDELPERIAAINDSRGASAAEANDLAEAIPHSEPNVPIAAIESSRPAATAGAPLSPEPAQNLITGVLVNSEGRPIPGFITLEGMVTDPGVEPSASFSIPEPAFALPGGLLGSACDASGLLGRRFIWRKGPQSSELTIVLEPGAMLLGRVLGADRTPVGGARVTLQTLMLENHWRGEGGSPHATVSDDEGYFHLDGVSVGPRVRCVAFLGTLIGRSRSLDIKPADVADAGEIVLTGSAPGSGVIRGRITDEDDLPLAGRTITVRVDRAMQEILTDADGGYMLTEMPTDRPITVTIEVPMYGVWSRTTVADDFACDFQLVPPGWGALGQEAPPLFADTWFNHLPMALKDLHGRVVLLTFRDFSMDGDPGLATIRTLLTDFGSRGLVVIAVYNHLSGGSAVAVDVVTTHIAGLFQGAPIAGILDADPDLVADLMPPGRPPAVSAGATHWLYQVHERPVSFLVDRKGIVRYYVARETDLWDKIERLLEE